MAAGIRKTSEIPLLLFTYLNPALRYGFERLARDARAAGIDGVLLTDVSVEEAGPYVKVMRQSGLDTVFLAAPTSTERRLQLVAEFSTGFVYLVSRTGVTGERAQLSDVFDQIRLQELFRREVYTDNQVATLRISSPLSHLAARFLQIPPPQLTDQTGLFRHVNEFFRPNQVASRMLPAEQGFEADNPPSI